MRTFFMVIASLILIWLGGYFWYLSELASKKNDNKEKTDAIVVLTGGQNRLNGAVKLLEEQYAAKLYISGVDEKVTRAELINLLGSSEDLAYCCIESGNEAADTVGNAIETMHWVSRNNVESLRVVTSLDHMPRAMVEFRRYMPEISFIEHPVGNWQAQKYNYFILSQEYSKYIISLLRARTSDQFYADVI